MRYSWSSTSCRASTYSAEDGGAEDPSGNGREASEPIISSHTAAVVDHLGVLHPEVHDAIFVPAGTVHSLGPDIVVFEVQQNSDLTYRLYDWGRTDDQGRPRETHVDKALAAIRFPGGDGGGGGGAAADKSNGDAGEWLFRNEFFTTRRYPLFSVLTIIAMALLGGAVHISEICRAGQRLDQRQRALIGLRQKRGKKFFPAPGYSVYRDVLRKLDLEEMERAFNRWLGEHEGILPRSLAMDGKTIVHKLGQTVSLVDADDGVPVAMCCNDEGQELPAAQALLSSGQVNLINATIAADALHCQDESAHEIVTGGGDYLLRVKANQPTLLARAEAVLEGSPPLFRKTRRATGASKSDSSSPAP